MNRIIATAASLLLGLTASAQAGIIVSSERSTFNASYDKVAFTLAGYTGLEATTPNTVVQLLEGTWTATPATAVMATPGSTSAQFRNNTTNVGGAADPRSYVNFDSNIAAAFTARVSTSTGTSQSFNGGWFTTVAADKLSPTGNSLLAEFFVTTGGDVSFAGVYGSTAQGPTQPTAFTTAAVPEPATLGLAAIGALGLLARRPAGR
jgi:hypothetical protein